MESSYDRGFKRYHAYGFRRRSLNSGDEMTEFERLKRDFDKRRFNPYEIYTIDLSTAREDMRIPISGDIIVVDNSTTSGVVFDIRFNDQCASKIRFDNDTKIETLFKEIYLTNTAQSGKTLILILGIKQFFGFFLRSSGSSTTNIVKYETPTPATDGVIVQFSTAFDMEAGTLEVYVDGVLKTITEDTSKLFTLGFAPDSDEDIVCHYVKQ